MLRNIQIKGSSLTVNTLYLYSNSINSIKDEISHLYNQAPGMFVNSPIILDLCHLQKDLSQGQLFVIKELIQHYGMRLIGVRNVSPNDTKQAEELGLSIFNNATSQTNKPTKTAQSTHKIHPNHLRSGQQISNLQGDITILGNVNPGSEVVAGGNVIIIGSLRGKVVAGASGDASSKIFCKENYAELIAINGQHMTTEEMDKQSIGASGYWHLNSESTQFIHLKCF